MTGLSKVIEARLEADRARAKVLESAKAIEVQLLGYREKLKPRRIAADLLDGAKSKGADLAEDAVDAVRARPIAATGAVAALALFLAREPLIDLAGKLVGGPKKKPEAKPVSKRSASRKKTETKTDG